MSDRTIAFAAPGRINLIGEHTDYNLGFALPIALPQRTVVTFSPDGSGRITVASAQEDDPVQIPLDTRPGDIAGWAGYVAGVIWAVTSTGYRVPGGFLQIRSDVPIGSGLSSSAALECAVLGALAAAAGAPLARLEQARVAQRAENEYVGAPTGLLDQIAVLFGEPGKAVLIDFAETRIQPVDFDPEVTGVALLLIDSRSRHQHAGGDYADRRASCERAAAAMGVSTLRDVQDRGVTALAEVADPIDMRRARHVITENQRVLDFVAAVGRGDFVAGGRIFTDSQASMRDDFQITTGHIDLIADSAVRAGALGARMTGGGFGGCVIALVPAERLDAVSTAVRADTLRAGLVDPIVSRTWAAAGADLC
ncbi:galactokinase [Mycobacterium sp. MAA66]|uniref:galactokinase n=1 Tax=Mycobacterium sp. MAA66 TaxID=3156297 RepID=UPI00351424BD